MKNNLLIQFSSYKTGYTFFKLTILFLSSLPLLSLFFGLISLIISSFRRKENYLSDVFNYPLLICGFFMLTSLFINQFRFPNFEFFENFIRLFNWLPLFWVFWGYQIYLNSPEKRKECMKFFLFSSFPIIIGGLLQYYFQIYGPFSFLGNLWFQRTICSGKLGEICVTGITSVFSNPNYYSSWLMLIFPISLGYSIYLLKKDSSFKYFSIIYTLIILLSSVLTFSRNAYLGIVFTLIFFFYRKRKKFTFLLINSLIGFISFLYFFALSAKNEFLLNLIYKIIKSDFNNNLNNFISYTRISLWIDSIKHIIENPLFGSGIFSASTLRMSEITFQESFKHTHNIILEVSTLYGLISSIFLFSAFFYIYTKSFKNIFFKNNFIKESNIFILEKSWIISFSAIFLTNMFDFSYYDIKISLPIWITLAGLRTCIKLPKKFELTNN